MLTFLNGASVEYEDSLDDKKCNAVLESFSWLLSTMFNDVAEYRYSFAVERNEVFVWSFYGWYSRSMRVARFEQLILTDVQMTWQFKYIQQRPSDLQRIPLCLIFSILNDKKIVCILSQLRIQIDSNLRNPTHSASAFLSSFLKKSSKQHRTSICLFLVYLKTR